MPATIHASAVLVGARAALIRGPSGAGKSRLALDLIHAARAGSLPFARLVADDRVHLEAANGRLLARPAEALAGLLRCAAPGSCGSRTRPALWSASWWTSLPQTPKGFRKREAKRRRLPA